MCNPVGTYSMATPHILPILESYYPDADNPIILTLTDRRANS